VRDKRTLLLTVLVPMVFYPALIMLAGGLGASQQMKEQAREISVGVHIASNTDESDLAVSKLSEDSERIQWSFNRGGNIKESLTNGEFDVIAELDLKQEKGKIPFLNVSLHYFSTARGEADLQRVETAFRKVKAKITHEAMGDVLQLGNYKDYASVRESSGSKFGGAAAYFIVFLSFTGCMAVAVDVAAGEKERGTLEAMLVTPTSFWQITFGKLMFVVAMGLLSVFSTAVGIGAMGIFVKSALEGVNVSMGGVGLVSILGILFLILIMVFFFAVLLFAMSILARSSKEAHMRCSLLMLFIAMALVYCTLPGVGTTGTILFIPVLNVALSLRALWEGSMSLLDYGVVVGSLVTLCTLILWFINRKVSKDPETILLK